MLTEIFLNQKIKTYYTGGGIKMKKIGSYLVFTVSLFSLLISGLNCSLLVGDGDTQKVDKDKPNAYTCRCTCTKALKEYARDFNVCMTDELNPNVEPNLGEIPTNDDLEGDCSSRVKAVAVGIANQCVSPQIIEDDCMCEPFFDQRFVDVCNKECQDVELALDCSNSDQASNVPGEEPVCLAEEMQEDKAQGLGNALFRRSTCDVEGNVTVDREGDIQKKDTEGVVEFIGEPCPGGNCDIGMSVRIDDVGTFSFGGFFGVLDANLKNVLLSGNSLETTSLDSSGTGTFPSGTTNSSGRGKLEVPLGDDKEGAYVAKNTEGIDVIVDWESQVCAVDGTLFTNTIEDKETKVGVEDLIGDIVNAPPTADAGLDRTVECESPSGASVTLDASSSEDIDNNIVLFQWRLEGPTGEVIGDIQGDFQTVIDVNQELGAQDYFLSVIDAFWQISGDTATVLVVDTTKPEITCPDDQTLECESGGASLVFNATASDVCFENPSVSCNPDSGSFFPLGETSVLCNATDGSDNSNDCDFTVTVQDTIAPVISSVSANPNNLLPPNHKMTPVTVSVDVSDICDAAPACHIAEVSSNEPVNGPGDGNTSPDWVITGDLTVDLRAERSGNGSGRVYTIIVDCTDGSGNISTETVEVTVPHNKGKKK
jgi:hypothetical protein